MFRKTLVHISSTALISSLMFACADPQDDEGAGSSGDDDGNGGASPVAETDDGDEEPTPDPDEEEEAGEEEEEGEPTPEPEEGEEEEEEGEEEEGEEEEEGGNPSTGGSDEGEPNCVDPVEDCEEADICQEAYCDARGECAVRDAANGSEASEWQEWTECQYPSECYESGIRGREREVCRSGKPVPDYQTEPCERDTDGIVVKEGELGECTGYTSICDEQGYKEKVDRVCENGVEVRQTSRETCTRNTDGREIHGPWSDCRETQFAEFNREGPQRDWSFLKTCGESREQWREVARCIDGQPSEGVSIEYQNCAPTIAGPESGDACGPTDQHHECWDYAVTPPKGPGPGIDVAPLNDESNNDAPIGSITSNSRPIPLGELDDGKPSPQYCSCPFNDIEAVPEFPGRDRALNSLLANLDLEGLEPLDLNPFQNGTWLGHVCAIRPAEVDARVEESTGSIGQATVQQGSEYYSVRWGQGMQADACEISPAIGIRNLPEACDFRTYISCYDGILQWPDMENGLPDGCELPRADRASQTNLDRLRNVNKTRTLGTDGGAPVTSVLACTPSAANTVSVEKLHCVVPKLPPVEPEPIPEEGPKFAPEDNQPLGDGPIYEPVNISVDIMCSSDSEHYGVCAEYEINWAFNPSPSRSWPIPMKEVP